MRFPHKVALGALLGALVALALAPYTRSFLFAGFAPLGLDTSLGDPPRLTGNPDLNESAAWVETWGQKVARRIPVSRADMDKVALVLRRAAEKDVQNAYWPQALSALESARGNSEAAAVAWREAGKKLSWNDYQHARLMARREQMDPEDHGWSYALAYGVQDYSVLERIKAYARNVTRSSPLETSEGMARRMDTLRNGELIRKFSRFVSVGEFGVQLIELAAYPPDLAPIRNPSKLILARMAFHDSLVKEGKSLDAGIADQAFRANDGWTAFVNSNDAADNATALRMALLLSSCFMGGLLWAALTGLILWSLGVLTSRADRWATMWRFPWCVILGVACGVATGVLTESFLAGLSVIGAFSLMAWKPHRVRYVVDYTLGPLYGFLVFLFCVLITAGVATLGAGLSRVGWSSAYRLPIPDEYYGGAPLVVGLVAIGIGFTMALGPAYAWAYRVDPPRLVSRTLTLLGHRMTMTCLVLVVLSASVVLYADRTLGDEMRKIVANEPLYYLQ